MKKTALASAAAAMLGVSLLAAPAATAAPAAKPDTACMQAGIATLKSIDGLFQSVAKNGLRVGDAVDGFGVAPRPGVEVDLDTVLPLSVVLADHRAGDNSLFVYPWCEALEG